jgi:uncharacterized protein involved in response to NO
MNELPLNRPVQSTGFALWNLGFRPFYLLASIFSAASVLLWAGQFSELLPYAYLASPLWHGHEMLIGYVTAVIAGFLLTAVRTWTGQPTASGRPLLALAALWVAGRVLVLTPWAIAAAVANATFPLAIAVAIGIPLVRSRNTRNYFFVGLLLLIGALVLATHLVFQGRLPAVLGLQGPDLLHVQLDLVLFIVAVIAGRVIPMFTNNGIPGTGASRNALLEKAALGGILLLFAGDLLQLSPGVTAILAFAAALAHGLRLALWKPWRTFGAPLVWILHAAYAWIVVHLALRGLTGLGLLGGSYAVHALTVGAIGGMTLGMMVRTARGHTGRVLLADRSEVTMFLLVQAAALVRVFAGVAAPALYLASIELSGLLWAAAFALYAVRYWPVLTRPRLDGKPG